MYFILLKKQEVGDTGEEMADSPVDIEDCQKGTALPSDLLPKLNFGEGFGVSDTSLNNGFAKNIGGDNADVNSISETSSSGSENFAVVEIDEDDSLVEVDVFNYPRKTEKSESSSSGDLTACVVQDSEEESDMQDGTEVTYFSPSVPNQQFFHQQAESTGNNNLNEINMLSSSEDQASESDDLHAPKRPRRTPPVCRRRRTRSLIRALHL